MKKLSKSRTFAWSWQPRWLMNRLPSLRTSIPLRGRKDPNFLFNGSSSCFERERGGGGGEWNIELYQILKIRNRESWLLSRKVKGIVKASKKLGLFVIFLSTRPVILNLWLLKSAKDCDSRILRTLIRSSSCETPFGPSLFVRSFALLRSRHWFVRLSNPEP